jgi:phosphoribosylformimino-5-aminoimidazole carboxamide ribotide isomerase
MLIPAIDLKDGKVVQLIQGETLAIETSDLDYWIERFSGFRRVNVIDLDAAKSSGSNDHLVREICTRLPCQVGGALG